MKTKIFALLLLAASVAFGQSLTSLFNLTPANGTTNGTAVSITGVRVPAPLIYLQLGSPGITNAIDWQTNVVSGVTNIVNTRTNIVKTTIQVSLDNTNWILLDSFYPASTNAGIITLTASNAIPVYMRASVFASNSTPVGVFKQ